MITHYLILIFLKISGGHLQNLVSPCIYIVLPSFCNISSLFDGLLLGTSLSQNLFKEQATDEYTQATKQI